MFAAIVWAVGTRLLSPLMERIARARSDRTAHPRRIRAPPSAWRVFAAEVFHVSVALGAFFAGLVIGQSRIGPQAAADMAPFRDVFSALFFVSIGMLFNPSVLVEQPGMLLLALGVVLVLKPLAALAHRAGCCATRCAPALTVAVGLAQIGEFSFILAALGISLGILPQQATNLLVAAAIASIAINPLLFRAIPAIERRFARRPLTDAASQGEPEVEPAMPAHGGATLVVCGLDDPARQLIERALEAGISVCVVDDRIERLEPWRARGVQVVFGGSARDAVLAAAGAASARVLVVNAASLPAKMLVCAAARRVNPRIAIVATAASEAEHAWLREFGVAYVAQVQDEIADSLLRAVRRSL